MTESNSHDRALALFALRRGGAHEIASALEEGSIGPREALEWLCDQNARDVVQGSGAPGAPPAPAPTPPTAPRVAGQFGLLTRARKATSDAPQTQNRLRRAKVMLTAP